MADQIFYAQLLVDVAAAKEIRLFGLGRFLRGRMVDERQAAGSREYGYVPAST